jgi:hypothetical protein
MHKELYFKAMLKQEKGKSFQLEMPWQPALLQEMKTSVLCFE